MKKFEKIYQIKSLYLTWQWKGGWRNEIHPTLHETNEWKFELNFISCTEMHCSFDVKISIPPRIPLFDFNEYS